MEMFVYKRFLLLIEEIINRNRIYLLLVLLLFNRADHRYKYASNRIFAHCLPRLVMSCTYCSELHPKGGVEQYHIFFKGRHFFYEPRSAQDQL